MARPSKRGQAESPSRKSQLEFVKIIIRPAWARGAMEERAYCASPPLLGYCGTKAAALRIANEVWTRVFAALCGCVCVSLCVCVGQEHKEPQKCVFWDVIKSFCLRFVFFFFCVSFGVLPFVRPSFTLTAFHPVLAKISKWNCCIICTFRIFICACPILPHRKKFSINFARLSFGGKQSVNKTGSQLAWSWVPYLSGQRSANLN